MSRLFLRQSFTQQLCISLLHIIYLTVYFLGNLWHRRHIIVREVILYSSGKVWVGSDTFSLLSVFVNL